VLLRADADALARGTVFWQESEDLVDTDFFNAAGEGPPTHNSRPRELQHQWIDFWGPDHIKRVSGPRGLRVRFKGKLRPGRVEPADLILDPDYHPGRDRLTVGADPLRQRTNANAGPSEQFQEPRAKPKPSGRSPNNGPLPF
jgi:serine/threonine-protein kinase